MIRFIVKRSQWDAYAQDLQTTYQTIDVVVPELEAALLVGGMGPSGYDRAELVGGEILHIKHSEDLL